MTIPGDDGADGEDPAAFLFRSLPPRPVVRRLPLMWPAADGSWGVRVLLDY